MSGHVVAGSSATPVTPSIWRAEFSDTVRLALPMALTQLGQIAMMTTNLALLGRLGDRVVAATALAHTILFGAFVIGMGIVSAVAPLAAQAFGAQQPHLVRRALRVGLWAAAMLGLPLSIAQIWLIGFSACYGLGFPLGLGAVGVSIGLSIGLIVYALLLVWRFHTLTCRGYLPDVFGTA